MSGRNCVGVRASGRIGGTRAREDRRYESSAGEIRVVDVEGAISVVLVAEVASRIGC